MTTLPSKTYIYVAMLIALTAAAVAFVGIPASRNLDRSHDLFMITMFIMILVAERARIDFPNRNFHFSVSVSSLLALGAAFVLDPVPAAALYVVAGVVVDLSTRLRPIQVLVNAATLGLATLIASSVYWRIAGEAAHPIENAQALVGAIAASLAFTTINLGSLSIIVAPVVGETTFGMWKANFSGTYVFVSLPLLGSLVPITYAANANFGVLILAVPLAGSQMALRALRNVELETQATIISLTDALEVRDSYTAHHSARVTEYAEAILEEMPHLPNRVKLTTVEAARIHDVGKIGIRDESLLKNGPLTPEERKEMERHSAIGAEIISNLGIYRQSAGIVRHHHERWDGKGYPDGLAGEEIPIGARVIAVADTFDAMTSNRPYRRALSFSVAMEEVLRCSGSQFDPQVVAAFERAMNKPLTSRASSLNTQPGHAD